MKPLLLRLHRWTTIVFAVPLAIVIVTGLILSFEPILQDTAARGLTLPASRIVALLAEHDPEGKARGLAIRAYEDRLVIQGVGEGGSKDIALSTGREVDDGDRFMLSDLFGESRYIHEHLLFDQRWLVTATTIAMVVLIVLGLLMGWPRIRNTISGWHQATAWFLLPLVILSPVTGLMIAFGVTLAGPQPIQDRAALPSIREAVEMLGRDRDLAGLIWLRNRGGRLLARVNEGGRFSVYQVSRSAVRASPANWPRGLHEGNSFGLMTGIMVVVTSLALIGLMVTGLTLWVRRTFLRKRNRNRLPPAGAPA
ncbi:MAG: PepSY domain-containing protein [Hyphomicrobiales bacterium]|nr:PepSY domain-containing protein [Hyphomicrobiales bacterium]